MENYLNGEKNGSSNRWFKTGKLLEESNWKNDKLDGVYRSFFLDGKVGLESKYDQGKRSGPFKTWFTDGTLELDAFYTNDLPDKDWLYYDSKGEVLYTLKYELGKLLNPEVKDSINAARFVNFKSRADSIPDPEKFMQNPEEYMNLMKSR